MFFIVVILFSGSLVAYAATDLFDQTIPGQTFNTPYLTGKCSSLVLEPSLSNIPLAGGSGFLLYSCSTSAAFVPTTNPGPATPKFNLPTGWTLSVAPSTADCIGVTNLTSGTPVTLTISAGYDYCLTTTSASNFSSFDVLWTQ
jgi:hypothetical protein